MSTKIAIKNDWIKLDSLLKLADVADTGGYAKMMIQDGAVSVNGDTVTARSKKVFPGDVVEVDADPSPIRIEVEKE